MYLGIDIGTSGVKAIVMEETGDVVAQATAPLTVSRPHPLWSEQDPADWWRVTQDAVLQLPQTARGAVKAIGLSGQMHGATVLDAQDQPIRPAILWNDGRSEQACRTLEARVPDLHTLAGNLAMPGFTAPKLIWLAEHEPDAFKQVAKVLLPKDYVRLLMTGDYASDMSDSAGTLWMDVGARDWSDQLLDACGLTRTHMPALHEGCDVTGTLRKEVATVWGLPADTPVVAGAGDNAAGAVGSGITAPGDAFLSLGTSGVLFAADTAYRPDASNGVHTFCHALPGLWHQMAVMLSAASCVDWAVRLTGAASAEALIHEAERADKFGAAIPLFLPYLSGERTPHNDPNATGALLGLTHDSGAADIAQAVLEGVALGFADGLSVLSASADIETITVIGGGSRSAYWGRILAAALARPLSYRKNADIGPALGAARLAQMGAHGQSQAAFEAPEIEHVIEPIAADVNIMAAKLDRYRQLYAHTKDLN
ncbi:MAG: xylulokinase [Hyphomonadaceae bacterium]|nr:xylulokinase [Hyphomonadaceae bacterium]